VDRSRHVGQWSNWEPRCWRGSGHAATHESTAISMSPPDRPAVVEQAPGSYRAIAGGVEIVRRRGMRRHPDLEPPSAQQEEWAETPDLDHIRVRSILSECLQR